MQQISLLPFWCEKWRLQEFRGAKVRESSAVTITLVLHPDSGQFSLESPDQKVNISPRVVGSMFLLQRRLVWRLLPTEEKRGEKLDQQTEKKMLPGDNFKWAKFKQKPD